MQAREHEGRVLGRTAFGLGLLTDLTPPGSWQAQALSEPVVELRPAPPQEIAALWSGSASLGWQGTVDGARFAAQRGQDGDLRFVHGDYPDASGALCAGTRAVHHLSADGAVLRCAPVDPLDPSWWRVVLDSVLFTVALDRGYEALHAAAVAAPDGGTIAIAAATGGGKSTLLSELLRRGLTLMADDVLVLSPSGPGAAPLAHPAPPLMTVPTVRLGSSPAPQPICSLQDECWIAMPAHPGPLPLRCLVVLDRRPQAALSLTRIEHPLAALMGSLMNFPRTRERERARFELASVLAATTDIWRLSADMDTPVDVLADALLDGVLRRSGRSSPAAHIPVPLSRC